MMVAFFKAGMFAQLHYRPLQLNGTDCRNMHLQSMDRAMSLYPKSRISLA